MMHTSLVCPICCSEHTQAVIMDPGELFPPDSNPKRVYSLVQNAIVLGRLNTSLRRRRFFTNFRSLHEAIERNRMLELYCQSMLTEPQHMAGIAYMVNGSQSESLMADCNLADNMPSALQQKVQPVGPLQTLWVQRNKLEEKSQRNCGLTLRSTNSKERKATLANSTARPTKEVKSFSARQMRCMHFVAKTKLP